MDDFDFSFDSPPAPLSAPPEPRRKPQKAAQKAPPAPRREEPIPEPPSDASPVLAPPESMDAEICVLGGCIIDPTALELVLRMASEDDFYRPAHRTIFLALKAIAGRGDPVDLVSLKDELVRSGDLDAIGGAAYLVELADSVPNAGNTPYYLKVAQDKALLRAAITIANDLRMHAFDASADPHVLLRDAELHIEQALSRISLGADGSMDARQAVEAVQAHVSEPERSKLVHTGIRALDVISGGLAQGDYCILGGVTGGGKTSLALHILANLCRAGGSVLYVSKEMRAPQLVQRILAAEANVPLSLIRAGDNRHYDLRTSLDEPAEYVRDWRFRVNRTASTVRDLVVAVRAFSHEYGDPSLVIVDYLTKLRGPGRGRYEMFSNVSSDLKQASLNELPCPILCLAQFGRDVGKEDRKPTRYDLKETGEIENDADFIWLLHCPRPAPSDRYHGLWIKQDKARQGPSNSWPDEDTPNGAVWLDWDRNTCKIMERRFQ